ncbi:MAG: hypothetical protein JOY71_13595 [Acetobacteraceae bacterium]|nr:hypothetical protein [Acetobacteraceae bacterium]MBV8588606.1 hypothetical protein [Acetobacteraceae bacterium]
MSIATIRLAALTAIVLGVGCTTSPQPTATGSPTAPVDASATSAPHTGRPNARASEACSSDITGPHGGGVEYLNCLANAESAKAVTVRPTSPIQ